MQDLASTGRVRSIIFYGQNLFVILTSWPRLINFINHVLQSRKGIAGDQGALPTRSLASEVPKTRINRLGRVTQVGCAGPGCRWWITREEHLILLERQYTQWEPGGILGHFIRDTRLVEISAKIRDATVFGNTNKQAVVRGFTIEHMTYWVPLEPSGHTGCKSGKNF